MKLTQKVEHFTVFKSFPSTSCCSQEFPPNSLEKIGWLDVRGSIREPGRGCAGSLMAEMKHNLQCGRLDC